jgi:SAM-dependent methyltransferase
MDIDSAGTTIARRKVVESKPLLRRIYIAWYRQIIQSLEFSNLRDKKILEIGSGAGFLDRYIPGLITSDVFRVDGLDLTLDACSLPFSSGSLDAIVMIDVFHHLPDVELFLEEAGRCLRPGSGKLIMIEPWNNIWSRFIYQRFHHEPFNPRAEQWQLRPDNVSNAMDGPLSVANGALPWIVFERDKQKFEADFPRLAVEEIYVQMPFTYVLSGGISLRSFFPGWAFNILRIIERLIFEGSLGMFSRIEVRRRDHQ